MRTKMRPNVKGSTLMKSKTAKTSTRNPKETAQTDDVDEEEDLLQFSEEDAEDEVDYWSNAVYCFIMGANPPWEVIEGYVKRVWKEHGIDKISFLPNRIFIVRFKEKDAKVKILNNGFFMFDNKPLIVKEWTPDAKLDKDDVQDVPIWIQLHELPLKFWGRCLPRIASIVGLYVKSDLATEERTRLGYARVMVLAKVGQKFKDSVKFLDEHGYMVEVRVQYEWKPIWCTKCKGYGHGVDDCEKEELRKARLDAKQVRMRQQTAKQPATVLNAVNAAAVNAVLQPAAAAAATVLDGLKYASSHEWVKHEGSVATIGVTDHAQGHLGDVVFAELPEQGKTTAAGKAFASVESVKATSDVNAPISGEIIEVNTKLTETPGLLNSSPYEDGWMIKIKPTNPAELETLMGPKEYTKFCEEEDAH